MVLLFVETMHTVLKRSHVLQLHAVMKGISVIQDDNIRYQRNTARKSGKLRGLLGAWMLVWLSKAQKQRGDTVIHLVHPILTPYSR